MPGNRSTAFRVVLAATLFGLVVMVALAAVLGVIAASGDEEASPPPARELVAEPTANEAPAEGILPRSGEAPQAAADPPPAASEAEVPAVRTTADARALPRGRIEPGHYSVERFDPDFSLVLGAGWRGQGDSAQVVSLSRGGGRNLSILRGPSHVFVPGTLETRRAPVDMLEWMRTHPCVRDATEPTLVSVGGNTGMEIEFRISGDPGCSGAYWEIDRGHVYTFKAGERDRLIALTVNAQGALHGLLVNVSTVDPAEFDGFSRRSARVLSTIEFA
jgi:hypothetical protein